MKRTKNRGTVQVNLFVSLFQRKAGYFYNWSYSYVLLSSKFYWTNLKNVAVYNTWQKLVMKWDQIIQTLLSRIEGSFNVFENLSLFPFTYKIYMNYDFSFPFKICVFTLTCINFSTRSSKMYDFLQSFLVPISTTSQSRLAGVTHFAVFRQCDAFVAIRFEIYGFLQSIVLLSSSWQLPLDIRWKARSQPEVKMHVFRRLSVVGKSFFELFLMMTSASHVY